jgi:myosin heavy subunit
MCTLSAPHCLHITSGVDRAVLEQSLITKYLNLDNTSSSSASNKRLSAIRTPRNAVQAAYSRDAMAKSLYQVSNDIMPPSDK